MSSEKFPNVDAIVLKDTAIFFGWIAGIIIIAGLSWALTQPIRNRFLIRSVNRVLEQSGDSYRLGELAPLGRSGSLMGTWYTMEEKKAYVFSFIGEGTFFPCAAIITAEGRVEEFIPLSSHGERILSRISPGILKLYARRIERIKS